MKIFRRICIAILLAGFCAFSIAVESGMFRLLSISEIEKLILVSQIPGKTKYILEAASAKITVNGKPVELKDLRAFSIVQLKLVLHKTTLKGVTIDGSATEIRISNPEKSQ